MNILREIRRVNKKSMPIRIILLLAFSVIFIVNTYAWFSMQNNVTFGGIEADLTAWDVKYYIDGKEVFEEEATFTIDELYPGMPEREDVVNIYNMGEFNANVTYELISVKVFGQEVLPQLRTNGEIKTEGYTTHLFSKDTTYPFDISYTYNRERLEGSYVDDATTPGAAAKFTFNVDWPYEGNGNETENLAKDILDTKFGKDAYEYYKNEENDPLKAIEVTVKITSTRADKIT